MIKADPILMHVKVYSPFKVYFDGQAASLSARNGVGPFDILPRHHRFISLLEPGKIIIRAPQKADFQMDIARGVMHVKADEVRVFLDV